MLPAESCTAARIHQGAWDEPVSQNKGITNHGMNGSSSFDASVIERITVRIDITGLNHVMDYIHSLHWH